jgi:hypothetical protein
MKMDDITRAETRKEAEKRIADNDLCGYIVRIRIHNADGLLKLDFPHTVREFVGAGLDRHGLQEDVDYTLEVDRCDI